MTHPVTPSVLAAATAATADALAAAAAATADALGRSTPSRSSCRTYTTASYPMSHTPSYSHAACFRTSYRR